MKLADDTPASDVALHAYIEKDKVTIKAIPWGGYGLECIKDNEVLTPAVSNGFYTFTVSNITNDVVVTIGYITVRFDLNNSNIADNFKPKPADITKIWDTTQPSHGLTPLQKSTVSVDGTRTKNVKVRGTTQQTK